MNDPWIAGKVTNAGAAGQGDQEEFKPDEEAFREGGANQGIQDRRHELVERMQEGGNKPEEHYWKEWFSIVDRHAKNSTLRYEWWSASKVDEAGILSLEGAKAVNEGGKDAASVEVIGQQLR